jgi:aryl-alcohol dehydrogenase-like predicted oxidoreductase
VDASLKRLGTDYIDILYFHRAIPELPLEEAVRAVGDLIRQGKLRYFGLSNFRGWRIGEVVRICDRLGIDRPVASEPLYNLVDRTAEVEQLPAAGHYGLGVVSYSPLARGVLTGKYAVGCAAARGYARRTRRQAHAADGVAPRVPARRASCRPARRATRHHLSGVRPGMGPEEPAGQHNHRRPTH